MQSRQIVVHPRIYISSIDFDNSLNLGMNAVVHDLVDRLQLVFAELVFNEILLLSRSGLQAVRQVLQYGVTLLIDHKVENVHTVFKLESSKLIDRKRKLLKHTHIVLLNRMDQRLDDFFACFLQDNLKSAGKA